MEDYKNLLDRKITRLIGKKNHGGIALALFDGKDIFYEYHDGYANKEMAIRSSSSVQYMIGSNTKVITSLAIMRLYEQGKVSLEEDIRTYLPKFSVKSRFEYQKITITDLLMHRSGIICDLYDFILEGGPGMHELIDALSETYMISKPGEMFAYSNLGYTVLGLIIEAVSGMDYAEYIQKNIFDPLNMKAMFLDNDGERSRHINVIAQSYGDKGELVKDTLATLLPAGSSTYCSLTDLVKIGQLLLNKGTYKGKRLYREETIELMETLNVKEEADRELINGGYGILHNSMKLKVRTGRILGHGGDTEYHHSVFNYLPEEQIGIVILSNFGHVPVLVNKIAPTVLEEYLISCGYKRIRKVRDKYVKEDNSRYAGKYDTGMGVIEFICTKANVLKIRMKGKTALCQIDQDGLICPLIPQKVKFSQTDYYGHQILIVHDPSGISAIFGERYQEPEISEPWRKACGKYAFTNDVMKTMFKDYSLSIRKSELVLRIKGEGDNMNYSLKVLNDHEAIVKGFGRNSHQTVTLKEEDGYYVLDCDGVRGTRKIR